MKIIDVNGKEYVECYGKARGKTWTTILYPYDTYKDEIEKKNAKPKRSNVQRDNCDSLWSRIIRSRANNTCEHCGKQGKVDAHHIIGRKNYRTRWDLDNGISLCSSCHTLSSNFSAHQTPLKFAEWLETYKPKLMDKLRIKANAKGQKQDLRLVFAYLKQEERK